MDYSGVDDKTYCDYRRDVVSFRYFSVSGSATTMFQIEYNIHSNDKKEGGKKRSIVCDFVYSSSIKCILHILPRGSRKGGFETGFVLHETNRYRNTTQ
jgi:hypothetical protein